MTPTILSLRGLTNLTIYSTFRTVRPTFCQALRYFSLQEDDERLSNIARVARQYRDAYGSKRVVEIDDKKDPKDRRVPIPVETSIRYLKSQAYKNTYGTEPVWVPYRRNHKGQKPPTLTRGTCIGDDGFLKTGNPCPICRDEYLVLHYKNVELLKQFISPYNGDILSFTKTNLCQVQHDNLLTAIIEAMDLGLLTYDVPFRKYDYEYYKPKQSLTN